MAPTVDLPAYFGATASTDIFFQPYTNGGKAIRTQVALSHHLLSLVQEGQKEVIVAGRREQVDASRMLLLSATSSIMSEHGLAGWPMRSVLMFFSPAFLLDFSVRHGLKPKGAAIDLQPLAPPLSPASSDRPPAPGARRGRTTADAADPPVRAPDA